MTFNSEIFSPNFASKQLSYSIFKNTRLLLVGFIGVSLVAIGFFNMPQAIRVKRSQFTQERCCGCGMNCLCGTDCGCSINNLR